MKPGALSGKKEHGKTRTPCRKVRKRVEQIYTSLVFATTSLGGKNIEIVDNSQDRILKRPEAIESQLGEFLGTNFFLPISVLKH